MDETGTGSRRWAAAIVGGLFLVAAFGKSWDGGEGVRFLWVVGRDLLSIEAAPATLAAMLLGVVVIETALGAYLLLARPSPIVAWATAGLLGAFTALHVWAMAVGAPPCGCLGVRAGGDAEAMLGIGRNVAAIYLLAWSVWPRPLAATEPHRDAAPALAAHGPRAGFTLVELLVAIVIVAVLGAILAPALRGAKRQSQHSNSLAMSRQAVAALSAYADDHYGFFPFMGTPGDPLEPLRVAGEVIPGAFLSGQSRRWATLCCPDYIEPREAIESARAREVDQELGVPDRAVRSHFYVTETLFARPQYWYGDEEPRFRADYFRGTRPSDVMFASQKGLVIDISFGVGTDEDKSEYLLTAFADGSAEHLAVSLAPESGVQRRYGSLGWPVLSTRDGLHGRDR